MSKSDFWDDQTSAQATVSQLTHLKNLCAPAKELKKKIADISALEELASESEDDPDLSAELESEVKSISAEIDSAEIASFLSGPLDANNAIVTIHAGAGGTEACDWASMLLRMYMRWAERRGFEVELQDIQDGEEAGITKATFTIKGLNAYGYTKAERGVHRLVRISPFDANKRRHTTFGSVDVISEITDDIDIEIKEEDLRIDTYRASGKGGQHVNKTESAVRITHIPSGIVVSCQNERSQIKNKQTAMKALKSRLYEKLLDEKRAEMDKFYGAKGEISWGNQIRSYVFQPYQMVKDLRTGTETGNVQAVMDGDLDIFIDSWLRAGCPKFRADRLQEED